MMNQTIGPPVTRLAKVNSLLMENDKQICTDFKYDSSIKNISMISWMSDAASGCKYKLIILKKIL